MAKTRNPVPRRSLYQLLAQNFAVNFGMGVVSGLVVRLPVRNELASPVRRQYHRAFINL